MLKLTCKIQKEELFMKEIWRDIEEYEGLYQVSNFGRVYIPIEF